MPWSNARTPLKSLWLAGLAALLLPASLSAQPSAIKILVAPPGLAPEISPAVAASIDRVVREGVAKRGATVASAEEVAAKQQQLGISKLASRADSTRVAAAMGAKAVLRYQAKRIAEQIHIRVAVFFIDSGKAVMLERAMLLGDLGKIVDAMLVELVPATAGASSGTTPEPSPTVDPGPSVPGIFTRINPHAGSGLVARLHFGGSKPVGSGSNLLAFGLRVGGELGYQIRLGRFQSITPQVAFSLSRWSLADEVINLNTFAPWDGSAMLIAAMGGVRYDIVLGPVLIWPAAIHFGFGHATLSIEEQGFSVADDSKSGFAMGYNFGAQFMIARGFGAGIVFEYTGAFVGDFSNLAISTAGFSFGLVLTGKLPFEPAS